MLTGFGGECNFQGRPGAFSIFLDEKVHVGVIQVAVPVVGKTELGVDDIGQVDPGGNQGGVHGVIALLARTGVLIKAGDSSAVLAEGPLVSRAAFYGELSLVGGKRLGIRKIHDGFFHAGHAGGMGQVHEVVLHRAAGKHLVREREGVGGGIGADGDGAGIGSGGDHHINGTGVTLRCSHGDLLVHLGIVAGGVGLEGYVQAGGVLQVDARQVQGGGARYGGLFATLFGFGLEFYVLDRFIGIGGRKHAEVNEGTQVEEVDFAVGFGLFIFRVVGDLRLYGKRYAGQGHGRGGAAFLRGAEGDDGFRLVVVGAVVGIGLGVGGDGFFAVKDYRFGRGGHVHFGITGVNFCSVGVHDIHAHPVSVLPFYAGIVQRGFGEIIGNGEGIIPALRAVVVFFGFVTRNGGDGTSHEGQREFEYLFHMPDGLKDLKEIGVKHIIVGNLVAVFVELAGKQDILLDGHFERLGDGRLVQLLFKHDGYCFFMFSAL